MAKHLQRDLEHLKREMLSIGDLVQEAITSAIHALTSRRTELAEQVIAGDHRIDTKEVRVEDECLKVLALHQPVAADLRFVVAVLKVNNDLERMGDLAVNIAKRARHLSSLPPLSAAVDLETMSTLVSQMVQRSLDALVQLDTAEARGVCASDQEVDDLHRHMYIELERIMQSDPETIDRAVQALSVSRALERIADLATNIAEDVVFMVEGEVIRHGLGTPP